LVVTKTVVCVDRSMCCGCGASRTRIAADTRVKCSTTLDSSTSPTRSKSPRPPVCCHHIRHWLVMSKYDVIHNTGSTQRITTSLRHQRRTEPRPYVTCIENWSRSTCSSEDMIADKQTHTETDRHAHHNTPLTYPGQSNITYG